MTMEPILSGKDIFAQAETGSGKTGAFVIPIIEQILRDNKEGSIGAHESRYVILSPTRELAQQTFKVCNMFGKELGIDSCCIIGGENIEKQKKLIGEGVHILVATPGRMVDLIKQKVVALKECKAVVFDEADRLFEMGFKKDIEFILGSTPKSRQIIMLSATSNQEVLSTVYKFNSHPEELKLNEDSLLVDHLDHKLAMVDQKEKFSLLVSLLRKKEDAYAIVFCNTQFQTHSVAEWLIAMGFKAKPISGRMAQNKRTKLMKDFREKKVTILVCTDVAARGLDIKNVNLVINYDLPQEAANYVHRIGRTGRAGEEGQAISFCAYEDCENLDPIYELIEAKIPKMDLDDDDFAKDICKKPYIDKKSLRVSTDNRENKHKKKTDHKKDRQPKKDREYKVKEKTQNKPVQNPGKRIDRRFFEFTSTSEKIASIKAMEFFKIHDEALLGHEVLEQGSKKYILFGPRETKYKFFIKPIYKKLLLPFLIELVTKMKLDLYVKVAFKPTTLYVNFSGKDEKYLTENKFELLNAFEYIIKNYLQSRVVLHQGLKIQVKCSKGKAQSKDSKDEQRILKIAKSMRKKVLEKNESIKLKPMNSAERRIVHQFFQDDEKIKTSSIGEGKLKQVELSLK